VRWTLLEHLAVEQDGLPRGSDLRVDLHVSELMRWLMICLGLAFLGTGLRLAVAVDGQTWNQSPDLWAWGALVDEPGPLRLDRLMHYPHEGGSLVVSLVALAAGSLVGHAIPPLVMASLALDTLFRFAVILLVDRTFGRRWALGYALWSVCAVPLLVWWSAVPVGLHALAGVFPMLFVAAAGTPAAGRARRMGIVCGIALLWGWDNVVLLAAAVALLVDRSAARQSATNVAVAVAWALALASVVVLVGARGDLGFELEPRGALWLRGVTWSAPDPVTTLRRVTSTLLVAFPYGVMLAAPLGWLWWSGWLALSLGSWTSPAAWAPLRAVAWVTSFYIAAYSLSPFASALPRPDPIAYRHLAFILPVMAVAGLDIGERRGWRRAIVGGLLALGLWGVVELFARPVARPPMAAAGWVLARKLGHDPARVEGLIAARPAAEQHEWLEGVGWGTTAVLGYAMTESLDSRLTRIVVLLSRYSAASAPALGRGVCRAFGPGITPRLDPALLAALQGAGAAPADCGAAPSAR
jgi:hypothetical protein